MKLYRDYIFNREGAHLIDDEFGFISYKINGKECFIVDMYIMPEMRSGAFGNKFLGGLIEKALESNCDHLSANIYLNDAGHERTLKAALKRGFKIVAAHNNTLTVLKNIGG